MLEDDAQPGAAGGGRTRSVPVTAAVRQTPPALLT